MKFFTYIETKILKHKKRLKLDLKIYNLVNWAEELNMYEAEKYFLFRRRFKS